MIRFRSVRKIQKIDGRKDPEFAEMSRIAKVPPARHRFQGQKSFCLAREVAALHPHRCRGAKGKHSPRLLFSSSSPAS